MKFNKIIISAILLGTLGTSSCKKFLDHTVDPNNPTVNVATPDLVLPAALRNTGFIYNNPTGGNATFAFAGIWMGSMSFSGNYAVSAENKTYDITDAFGQGLWTLCYDNNADYDFIEKKGIETKNKFYQGVGRLMKAYNYQTLVDVYNKVPYSEALKGAAVPNPKYDDGQVIYESLLDDVDAAIKLFEESTGASTKGDIMFNGNIGNWIKFANTVRLRLLIRQSARADRQSYIASKASGQKSDYISGNVHINPGFQNTTGKQNPFWENSYNLQGVYNEDYYRAGGPAINFMKANNDNRIGRYFQSVGGDYVGNFLGEQGLVNSKTSGFGPGVLQSFAQPMILMTHAESYFLQAEAALKGIISGDAKALYEDGVKASFAQLGASDPETYLAQAGNKNTNWDACANNAERLELIVKQKWAATMMINLLEAWNDYRRTGYPSDVHLSTDPASTGAIPNRLLYPRRESTVNGSSVAAAGPATATSKIWWQN